MDKLVFSWKQSGVISTGNSQPTAVVMILSQYLWCRQKAQTAGSAQSSPKDLLFTTVEWFFFSFQKKDANCLVSALVILCYLLHLHTTVHSSNRHQKRKGKEKFLVIPVHHITSLYFCYFAQLKLCFMICIYIREYALLCKNTVILRNETTNLGHLCHLDYLNHCIKMSRSFLFSPLAQWILTSAQPNSFKRSSVAACTVKLILEVWPFSSERQGLYRDLSRGQVGFISHIMGEWSSP